MDDGTFGSLKPLHSLDQLRAGIARALGDEVAGIKRKDYGQTNAVYFATLVSGLDCVIKVPPGARGFHRLAEEAWAFKRVPPRRSSDAGGSRPRARSGRVSGGVQHHPPHPGRKRRPREADRGRAPSGLRTDQRPSGAHPLDQRRRIRPPAPAGRDVRRATPNTTRKSLARAVRGRLAAGASYKRPDGTSTDRCPPAAIRAEP
jgi:hypothetical protein